MAAPRRKNVLLNHETKRFSCKCGAMLRWDTKEKAEQFCRHVDSCVHLATIADASAREKMKTLVMKLYGVPSLKFDLPSW